MRMASDLTLAAKRRWYWLLALPFIGLLFPAWYSRITPELVGIPFFYWYQLGWVVLTALITGFVYWRVRPARAPKGLR